VKLSDFHRAVNHVQPGTNRVRADAATYDLHILIRFELERALISGDLPASELPAAWKAQHQALLGVTPMGDAEGCLQDGHWGAGQFGYFPTYTLGNLFAAQFFARLRADLPNLATEVAEGEFATLREWLRDRLYRHGRRFTSDELLRRATGRGIDHRPLVAMLRERYTELYGL
jgi:carboxypeptidase Taq